MKIFKLPDLGEGLTEAEIHEWHVTEGEEVNVDQLMVSVETAKAVVDVPAPTHGRIVKLYGKVGDIIQVGHPLVEFSTDIAVAVDSHSQADAGSVVGNLKQETSTVLESANLIRKTTAASQLIFPEIRALARHLRVDITHVKGTGSHGRITKEDIRQAASQQQQPPKGYEPLRSIRRIMAKSMSQSHTEIVPVTIYDDADIGAWQAGTDITSRVIRAVIAACQTEPALNAWYHTDTLSRKLHPQVDLGIALDSPDGLFVPVIHQASHMKPTQWRETIERFKKQVADRSIEQHELKDPTITLSNFGTFAGKYANPIIVPPTVAILGTGRIREQPVVRAGAIVASRIMPLSLTFDHRAATGGEATRFLRALIENVELDE